MKKFGITLAALLSCLGIAALFAGLLGKTHQFAMFVICLIVAIPMWEEIYKEWKKEKANEL
ncbi:MULTISPECIES: hypothetical protein [Butyricimonas]|uniref:hypothetical protein n=1 Tax=Butyricimonas TaxID=574697 RepID=UPI0007FB33D4|nr:MULTISPECIES: hypothetical protein [Butyricimonas]